MKRNNEVRFPITSQEKEALHLLWLEIDKNLKLTGFYYKVFCLGLNEVKKQVVSQGKESIMLKALNKK